jgi:hypothetical protein
MVVRSEKEGSSSFLKKEPKKLLLFGMRTELALRASQQTKVFWFFFSKKNCFLASYCG